MKQIILQLNYAAGNIQENASIILQAIKSQTEPCIFITPELALTGLISCDYFRYPAFIQQAREIGERLTNELAGSPHALVLGTIHQDKNTCLYNGAFFIHKGQITAIATKKLLADNEKLYFSPGNGGQFVNFNNQKFALCLGDDCAQFAEKAQTGDFDCLLNLCNYSFVAEAALDKQKMLAEIFAAKQIQAIQANAAGACDGTIFPGASLFLNRQGHGQLAPFFSSRILDCDASQTHNSLSDFQYDENDLIFKALCLGVKSYCDKSGHKKTVLGLSGGIDSALVAVIACHAMGAENVTALLMPSPWSSEHSIRDSQDLAANLGIKTVILSIADIMNAFYTALAPMFADLKPDVTEENLQARIRGVLVMAHANKFHSLALATGNKSELAVGYSTMYGDTCGALEVIGDLYKTKVYELCSWLNNNYNNVIPGNILLKAPSAELRPDQKDSDSLPQYPILDSILTALLDKRLDVNEIAASGHDRATVEKVAKLVAQAQFKRLQSPPVIHVHKPVFLNMPICGTFPFNS